MFIAELNAEELISRVCQLHPPPVIPFSSSHCSVYEKPVAAAHNKDLLNDLCAEISAFKKGFYAGDETSVFPLHPIKDAGCASNCILAPELCSMLPEGQRDEDPSITSPEDKRDARIADTNHEPALSLATIQRSRSRQKALELRNSAKASKCHLADKKNASSNAGGLVDTSISSFQSDQLFGLNLIKPLDTDNETCAAKDLKVGEFLSIEKDTAADSTKAISDQKHGLSNASDLSCVVREDGAAFANSMSNYVNQPLELSNQSCAAYGSLEANEAVVGDYRSRDGGSNIYFRRITRSLNSSQQKHCVNELSKLDDSSDNDKDDGVGNFTRQPKLANEGELVKSFDITQESCGMKPKAKVCQSKERGSNDYDGRITRLRSSNQLCNTVHDLSKLVRLSPTEKNLELCAVNGKEHPRKRNYSEGYISRRTGSRATSSSEKMSKAVSLDASSQIISQSALAASNKSHYVKRTKISGRGSFLEDLELCAANSTDSSDKETIAGAYAGRNTRIETASTAERALKPVNSCDLGYRGTRSRSSALNKSLPAKSLNRYQGIEDQDLSGANVKDLPCTSTSEIDLDRCAESVKANESDPDKQVEAHSVCSMSNSDGVGLRVGLEISAPESFTDCSMLVNPKQLNFDDVEEFSVVNGISTLPLRQDTQGRSSEQRPLTLSDPADILDNVSSVDYQEKCYSSPEIPLQEVQEVLSRVEEPQRGLSEEIAEDKDKEVNATTGSAISSLKEIFDVHKDLVLQTSLKKDKTSQKKSLTENSTTLNEPWECSPRSLLNEIMDSHLCNGNGNTSRINVSSAKDNGFSAVKHAELFSEDSKLDTHYFGDPNIAKDNDFLVVTRLGLPGNMDVYRDLTDVDSLVSSHGDTDVGCSKSTEHQIEEKSKTRGSFSSFMEGSWTLNKRRKIGPVETQSASPDFKEVALYTMNNDSMSSDLLGEEHRPKAIPESQNLLISEEDVSQLIVSGDQVEMDQTEEPNVKMGSELSPKVPMEEVFGFLFCIVKSFRLTWIMSANFEIHI